MTRPTAQHEDESIQRRLAVARRRVLTGRGPGASDTEIYAHTRGLAELAGQPMPQALEQTAEAATDTRLGIACDSRQLHRWVSGTQGLEGTMTRSHLATRLVGFGTGGLGAYLLARPDRLAEAVAGGRPVPPSLVVRVLGLRSLLQGSTLVAIPTRPLLALAAGVDGLHAASMVLLAAVDHRYRRSALASAAVATASCLTEAILARHWNRVRS